MPHLPAAVLILLERPHPDKQGALALAAAAAEKLHVVALCHHWQDAMALIVTHHIVAVVTALDPGPDVRAAIERLGGRLVVARKSTCRIRRSVDQLVTRLARRGMEVEEIAEVLDVPTREIRRSLGQPPRASPDPE